MPPSDEEVKKTITLRGPLTVDKIRRFVELTDDADPNAQVTVKESRWWPGGGLDPGSISATYPMREDAEFEEKGSVSSDH